MQCHQAPNRLHTLRRGAAATLGALLLAGCEFETEASSEQNSSPPFSESIHGTWYVSDCEIIFDENSNTFEVSNFIGGFYQLTERGDYVSAGVPGVLSGFPLVDLMGGYGLSDNGDPFELDLLTRTQETLILETAEGHTVVLSLYPPDLDSPPIDDHFDGNDLDPRWWTIGNTWVSQGQLHLQGDAAAAGLWQLGFTRLQADMRLEAANGHANVAMGFRPFDDRIVAKCGVGQSDLYETTVFCQVLDLETEESLFYADLKSTQIGATHQVMMVWTSGRVEFYADGTMVQSYTPPFEGNLSFCGEPDLFAWGDGVYGSVERFNAQN